MSDWEIAVGLEESGPDSVVPLKFLKKAKSAAKRNRKLTAQN